MKKSWLVILALLLVFVGCPPQHKNAAKIYITQGEFHRAKEQIKMGIEETPGDYEYYCLLGKVEVQLGNWQAGSEAFRDAFKIDSALTLKWMLVTEKANASYYWQNFYNAAVKLTTEKKFDEALYYLGFAKRIDPTNVQQLILEGNIQAARGDKDGAVKTYGNVIAIDPDNPEAYYFIALSTYEKQQWDSSAACFMNAIKNYAKLYDQLKGVLFQNIAFTQGLAAEIVDLWNKKSEELDRVLKAKFGFDQPEAQRRNVERFAKVTDGLGLSYYYAGMVFYSSGKDSMALKYLTAATEVIPGDVNALFFLGELLLSKFKKYDDARTVFEKVTVIKPDDFAAWFYIGVCYAQDKKYQKAIEMYEDKALKLEPKNIDVMTNLAFAYREIGNTKKALEYLMRIQELEKEKK